MSDETPPVQPKGPPRIQLQLDEATAQGIYSNLVLINHSQNEFILDFAFFAPGAPGAKVRARIISSPGHTKRLLRALQTNLERYEQRFGPVDVGDEEPPMVH
jgi:hypothetical protein